MNAEQIANMAVDEWDADRGLLIDMMMGEWICHRLREAGIDLDHTYEPGPAGTTYHGDALVLFVRRPLGADE